MNLPASPWLVIPLALVASLVLVLVVRFRPRLLLLPILLPIGWAFAVARWLRVILQLPYQFRDYLARAGEEKTAAALDHYAQIAMTIGTAGGEFLPPARELFRRVVVGSGLPLPEPGDHEPAIRPLAMDPFTQASRSAASDAVNASRGGKK